MTEAFIKGLGLGLILTLSVGPVIFTIIKQSINNGHRGGFAFAAGVWLSDLFLVVLSNMFTELVRQLLEFKKVIAYVGSGFLIGMGLYFVFFKKVNIRPTDLQDVPSLSTSDYARTIVSGFLINSLNPSIILFWLINATAFATTHDIGERIMIFGVCLIINIISDIIKVMMAGSIRERLTDRNIGHINKISGSILVFFGLALFYGVIFMKSRSS